MLFIVYINSYILYILFMYIKYLINNIDRYNVFNLQYCIPRYQTKYSYRWEIREGIPSYPQISIQYIHRISYRISYRFNSHDIKARIATLYCYDVLSIPYSYLGSNAGIYSYMYSYVVLYSVIYCSYILQLCIYSYVYCIV